MGHYSPQDIMVDITNDFSVCVLRLVSSRRENIAFSPYGLMSVALVMYEGAHGATAGEIHNTLRLPWDHDIVRIGFRDMHRYLKTYFSNDGFLRGLVLSKPNVELHRNYSRILQFYGFDMSPEGTTTTTGWTVKQTTTPIPQNTTNTQRTVSNTIIETTTPETIAATMNDELPPPKSEDRMETESPDLNDEVLELTTTKILNMNTETTSQETVTEAIAARTEDDIIIDPETTPQTINADIPPTDEVKESNDEVAQNVPESLEIISTSTNNPGEIMENKDLESSTPNPSVTESELEKKQNEEIKIYETPLLTTPIITILKESTNHVDEDKTVTTEMPTIDLNMKEKQENSVPSFRMTTSGLHSTTLDQYLTNPTLIQSEITSILEKIESIIEENTKVYDPEQMSTILENPTIQKELFDSQITSTAKSMIKEIVTQMKINNDEELTKKAETEITSTEGKTIIEENMFNLSQIGNNLNVKSSKKISINNFIESIEKELSKVPQMVEEKQTTVTEIVDTKEETTIANFTVETPLITVIDSTETIGTVIGINSTETTGFITNTESSNATFEEEVSNKTENASVEMTTYTDNSNSVDETIEPPNERRKRSYHHKYAHRDAISNWVPQYQDVRWGYPSVNEHWFFTSNGGHNVPVLSYTAFLPFAYIPEIGSLALELPLDDPRYSMLILLPQERLGINRLLNSLQWCSVRAIIKSLKISAVYAVVPTFTLVKHINLVPALTQLGVVSLFDPFKSDLSGMSPESQHLYVRTIEQVVTVSLRKYPTNNRSGYDAVPPRVDQHFIANHPFVYFVTDKETQVALMAGTIVNPLIHNQYLY